MPTSPRAWADRRNRKEGKRMSRIELTGIDKFYGSNHVLKNLNLTI